MFSHLIASTFYIYMSAQAGAATSTDNYHDGQIVTNTEKTILVWDTETTTPLSIEAFWLAYAQRNGGKYWGKSSEYPPYDEVNEHDTLLIELASEACLMEFFHARWRRANDVRRWDDIYNDYSACPNVFD